MRAIATVVAAALTSCAVTPEIRYELVPVPGGYLRPAVSSTTLADDEMRGVAVGSFGSVTVAARLIEQPGLIGVDLTVENKGTEDFVLDPSTVHLLDGTGMVLARVDAASEADQLRQAAGAVRPIKNSRDDLPPDRRNGWDNVGKDLRQLGATIRRDQLSDRAAELSGTAIPATGLVVLSGAWASGIVYFRDVETTGYQLRIGDTRTSFKYREVHQP